MTAILGLNAFHGDAAAALVIDGELVAAAEEERFNRVKHCAGFPVLAARWCLEDAGVEPGQLDHVAIGRDPKANGGAKLRRMVTRPPSPASVLSRARNAARVGAGGARGALAGAFGVPESSLTATMHAVEHHQAHVASAFLVSPFDDAAVLSVDGFGDFTSTMLATGSGSSVEVLDRVLFPHSMGIFYTAITQWLGFPHYGDEGKVMGLAPYGDPERFLPAMRKIAVTDDGLFALALEHFTHHTKGVELTWDAGSPTVGRIFSTRLEDELGPSRAAGEELAARHNDVAAAVQVRLEELILHVTGVLAKRTGSKKLCLAGGVALNAVANGRIRLETPFEELYVQAAAGDSGTAIGAAFHVWNRTLGKPRRFVMRHAYTGPAYDDSRIEAALAAADLPYERLDDEELFPSVAERLAAGDVVGWFQGRMEMGPRALGNRSILADPRSTEMKDILNARVKHREPFRPFAPSILAEATGEWFDQSYTSPFMVLVYDVLPEKRALVPAITHVDGTGRLQTVEEDASPRYYRLISEFDRLTGVPILLNTSFNENEPVVMSPEHALDTFGKTRIDLLVLGNYVVRREGGSSATNSRAATSAVVETSQE
ncbi:MAG TPA: carbamoyltransferase C-terminal domain-containing protein [Gaiellaceae bacterium]